MMRAYKKDGFRSYWYSCEENFPFAGLEMLEAGMTDSMSIALQACAKLHDPTSTSHETKTHTYH